MFVRKAALRVVPEYAVVGESAIRSVEETLDTEDNLQEVLDAGYRELDRRQPHLGAWLADEVAARNDEMAQSVGYFLAVTVYLAFREAFPTRLLEVDTDALQMALDTFETDEALRAEDPSEIFDTDDLVAMSQPSLLHFVQHHLEKAIEQAGDQANLEDLDGIYRAVLVEVIALSHAVASPSGEIGPPRNALA